MTRRSTDNPMAKQEQQDSKVDVNHPQYIAGASAFNAGLDVDDCPFHQGETGQLEWLNGWYGERTDKWIRDFNERWNRTHRMKLLDRKR